MTDSFFCVFFVFFVILERLHTDNEVCSLYYFYIYNVAARASAQRSPSIAAETIPPA